MKRIELESGKVPISLENVNEYESELLKRLEEVVEISKEVPYIPEIQKKIIELQNKVLAYVEPKFLTPEQRFKGLYRYMQEVNLHGYSLAIMLLHKEMRATT